MGASKQRVTVSSRGSRHHEDAGAGERADAHVAPVDLDRDRAVGRRRSDDTGAARLDARGLQEVEEAGRELELLGDAVDGEPLADRDLGEEAESRGADLAASYQRAIVDALVERTRGALQRESLERLAIGGGVAANSELRAAVEDLDAEVWVPPLELCTDNAAMIAGAARFLEPVKYPGYLSLDGAARL